MNTSLSLPAELNHPAIALEAASSSETPAPAPIPAPAPTVPLISTFGNGTQRQLELTVNAMARTVRKTIRRAEALEREGNYAEAAKVWEHVNQRSVMLQELSRTLATAVPQPASQVQVQAPTPAPAPAIVAEPRDLAEDAAQIDAMISELTRLQNINDMQDAGLRDRKIRDVAAQKARIRDAYLHLAARVPASPLPPATAS